MNSQLSIMAKHDRELAVREKAFMSGGSIIRG